MAEDPKPSTDRAPADSAAPSFHDAIQQQIAEVLANAELSEEERQQILVAMQCPCCGAGGLSLSIKLTGARSRPSF
ncbi:MAG: hypothetical protein JO128_16700 [Alphaproteobacteria bacterium]|nr:hypothetical protein [Alphaproteobacteria bacterium]